MLLIKSIEIPSNDNLQNLLREYLPSIPGVSTSYWSESGTDVDEDDEILVWREKSAGAVHYGPQLTEQQRKDLDSMMSEFAEVIADTLGRTSCAEHSIETPCATSSLPHSLCL